MEFSENITTEGRTILHEIADSFKLAHHSVGKKGKNRRTLIYPRTMHQDKQLSEIAKHIKDRQKLREGQCSKWQFGDEPPTKNFTFQEKVILEFWYDKKGVEPPAAVRSYIPTEK